MKETIIKLLNSANYEDWLIADEFLFEYFNIRLMKSITHQNRILYVHSKVREILGYPYLKNNVLYYK